jgi:hypothetical protein
MTPLEAARALCAGVVAIDENGACWYCAERQDCWHVPSVEVVHDPDCPWLQMGAIVEALEFLEALRDVSLKPFRFLGETGGPSHRWFTGTGPLRSSATWTPEPDPPPD